MSAFVKSIFLSCFSLCLVGSQATALPATSRTHAAELPTPASELADIAPHIAPIALVKFCIAYEDQCQAAPTDERIELTPELWAQIKAVNARINARIRPDAQKGGYDWSLETTYGNCNDYAVQKRKALLDLGLPASALSLAATITGGGVGHLVLTLRTDRGDFVLDNLRSSIVAWDKTGYIWKGRQSARDPNAWMEVDASGAQRYQAKLKTSAPRQQIALGATSFDASMSFDALAPIAPLAGPTILGAATVAAAPVSIASVAPTNGVDAQAELRLQ
jgi:predicted transglutaminase-like cysteine proteinase